MSVGPGITGVLPILVFKPGPTVGGTFVGWKGPWPPPEEMLVLIGDLTGRRSYVDPNDPQAQPLLGKLVETSSIHTVRYRRENFTKDGQLLALYVIAGCS